MSAENSSSPQTYLSLADVKLVSSRSSKPGKLVVKHTFLEVDNRSNSPSSHSPLLRQRASSDSALFERLQQGNLGTDSFCSPPEEELPIGEEIVLCGLSDSEDLASKAEDEESNTTATRSANASRTVYSSDVSVSFNSEIASQQEVTSKEPVLPLNLESLCCENARLARENAILRQQCVEVARAAQLAATSNAPTTPSVEHEPFIDSRACGTAPSPMSATGGHAFAQTGPAMMPGASPQPLAFFCQLPGSLGPVLAFPAGAMPMMMPEAPVQARADQHITPQTPHQGQFTQSHQAKERKHMRLQNMRLTAAGLSGAQALDSAFDSVPMSQATDSKVVENTTVMLRNIPNNYNRSMLLKLMDAEGFARQYDFVYLPVDFKSRATLGYAFVNLTSHEAAVAFMKVFRGYSNWVLPSRKVCSVDWSGPHQGLEAHVERYRNSPVMHEVVPDMYKPILFKDGFQVPFPAPTKKLREPRIRNY